MSTLRRSARRVRRLFTVLAALALLGATPGLSPFATSTAHAAVGVGLGSYTTTLPPGAKTPSNSDGAPVSPKKTANVTGAMPTNDWWSSLGFQRYAGNPYSENMYAHPLALRAKPGGLGVSYPTNTVVGSGNPSYLQEFHASYAEDLMLGVAGLNSPDTKVDAFSEWTVTGLWSGAGRTLRATFGHGLPFVYATKTGGDALVVFNGAPTIWSNSGGVIGATVNGHHYGLFAPTGATWTISGSNAQSSLAGKDYFSVAVLPSNTTAALDLYKKYAYSFVTNTSVWWGYNAASARLTTNYTVTTVAKEGTQTGTLMALYRHQWLNSTDALTSYTYSSPRGAMKVREGATFSTGMTFNGVLPSMPDAGTYDRTTLYNYVNSFYAANAYWAGQTDGTYWTGKALGRLAMLVRIADQVGHTAARDSFLSAMKGRLQDWLQAPDGKSSRVFYYNSTWGTLIGYPAEYGSDTELNDHHFHYAYYVMAAATVAQYDPAWATDANWGGMIKLLIKDAANWDSADTRFPRLRNFDPYAGHSWAAGHAGFAAGNNQESSSEAINFSTALILWGSATGDTTIRDLGIYLYTNEVSAIEQYWFDVNDTVFPSGFTHPTVGIVWGDGGSYSTWWTANPEEIHGINFLPITGGSLYLGRNPANVNANYTDMVATNGGEPTVWQDLLWSSYAFSNAGTSGGALAKFNANPNYVPEDGETKAHTYHWLHNLNALGQLNRTVTANIPTYAVFDKGSTRSYVAWNPGASAITVTFSDGKTMSVGARALISSTGAGTGSGGTGTGLKGEYFGNITLTGSPGLTRTDAQVNFDWAGSPGSPIGADNFSVRWTGQVEAPVAGSYTFATTSDDGVRLWVNGQQLVNNWTDHGSTTNTGPAITLTAGQKVSVTMEFYEKTGGAVAKLLWSYPGQAQQPVPQTRLYPAAGGGGGTRGDTLYVIDGAAQGTPGALAFSAGTAAASDSVPAAGGGNYDGAPHAQLVYSVSGVSGTYDSARSTGFSVYVDAGANVGDGAQVRVSYDLNGDGTFDRVETYTYFATNDVAGWEQYTQARGIKTATGALGTMTNGTIKLEVWAAIGTHTLSLRTSATGANGQQSTVTIPFTNVQ